MRGNRLTAIEAILQRERRPYGAIAVRPLSPVIGAEVEGVDLRLEPTEQESAELRRALLEHHVLVFRDHAVSAAQHCRIATMFGFTREPGRRRVAIPPDEPSSPADPLLMGEAWRTDETYRSTPPAGGVLHVEGVPGPDAGGDMLFANMHLAYELLSPQLKALLAELTAIHTPDGATGKDADASATAEHPVVIRHPLTGRPALYVSRGYTSHIPQVGPKHSDMTLDMLCRHLEANPVLTCRIRLTPNAVVIWDSRATQHLTLQDFGRGRLYGHQMSLAGDRPERWAS
jgi:taurine dioxygenase